MSLAAQASGPEGAPTIVFLHGFGTSSWMWADQVHALSADLRCVTIDLPGFGGSREVPWESLESTAGLVVDVLAGLDDPATHGADPRGVHVVGLSLGAYLGWHLLRDHGDLLASAVLSGITLEPLRPRALWRGIARWGAPLMTSAPLARLSARAMQLPEEARAAYVADATGVPHDTFRRVYGEIADFDPAPLDADCPVLVLAGGKELAPVQRSLEAGPRLIRGARAAAAPGLHHGWNGEDPDLFNATVAAWVRGGPLPGVLDLR